MSPWVAFRSIAFLIFLIATCCADVEVSVVVDGQPHTFRAGESEDLSVVGKRALAWCMNDISVQDPGCADGITARIQHLQLSKQETTLTTRDTLQRVAEELSNGRSVDKPYIDRLEMICRELSSRGDASLADGYYLLSVSLRRMPESELRDARKALEIALKLTTDHPVQSWIQEHSSFLAAVTAIRERDEDESADGAAVAALTFDRMTNSLLGSIEATAPFSCSSVDDLGHAVSVFAQTAQRIRARGFSSAAQVSLGLGFDRLLGILGEAKKGCSEVEAMQQLREIRFLVLRALISIRPRTAATLFQHFVDEPYVGAPSLVELLWAAYSQLFPSYMSVDESERSVASFCKLTRRAAAASNVHETGEWRNHGGSLPPPPSPASSSLLTELPIAPHWRLGFSGPLGEDIFQSLSDWSRVVRAIAEGPTGHSWKQNHLRRSKKEAIEEEEEEPENSKNLVAVGFVSSWFCNSAVGRLMLGLVRELDRSKYFVHVFHVRSLNGKLNRDETMTLDFDAAADKTHIMTLDGGKTSMAGAMGPAVSTVQSANLNVLVFCDIGMEPATYFLALHRIVPTQVVFWGHPFTSGISDTVDFYILPQGAEDVGGGGGELTDFRASTTSRYQEQLVRFDTLGAYYDRVSDPGPSSNQIPSMYGPWRWVETFEHRRQVLTAATQEDAVTFLDGSLVDVFGSHGHVLDATLYACPQHCGKFHPLFDQALIRILQVDSAAVLLLRDCGVADLGLTEINQGNKDTKEVTPSFATRLLEREDGLSLASRILVIRHQLPLSSFLRLLGSAHVALEPFPFPASITTLDAFTVGTPVIAHGGALHTRGMAQLSAGLYRRMVAHQETIPSSTIQIGECCIARNMSDFVELSVAVANNVEGLRVRASADIVRLSGLLFEDREAVKEWESFIDSLVSVEEKKNPTSSSLSAFLSEFDAVGSEFVQRDPRQFLEAYLQAVSECLHCGNTTTSSELDSEYKWWMKTAAADAWSNGCATVGEFSTEANMRTHAMATKESIAEALQENAGALAWIFQVVQATTPKVERHSTTQEVARNVASLVALGARASVSLEPRLINAAMFGAIGMVHLKQWDAAAQLYAAAANLKRPFFPVALGEESKQAQDLLEVGDGEMDWEASARHDPRSAMLIPSGRISHPSTAFDVGGDVGSSSVGDIELRPFRRLQFGGYNSALVRHLASQLRHLVSSRSVLPFSFLEVAEELDSIGDAMDAQRGGLRYHDADRDDLLPPDREHVEINLPAPTVGKKGSSSNSNGNSNAVDGFSLYRAVAVLGRTVYLRPTPALASGALSKKFFLQPEEEEEVASTLTTAAAASAEKEFETRGVTVLDGFLSSEALRELRAYCEDSTFYHKNYIQGYVGAFMGDGFGSAGLLHQLASELKIAFPNILGDKRLVQAWSYKYDEGHERGIDPHSDAGAVSVNLWLTPDEANLDLGSGGLLIWPEPPPDDWSFGQSNVNTEAIRAHLDSKKFRKEPTPLEEWRDNHQEQSGSDQDSNNQEEGLEVLKVPHRVNRCIIFQSRLFHQTDVIRFKRGYRNRRINVTLLFQ